MALVDEESPDGNDLLPWEQEFAMEYFAGEHAGNGTRAMMKVRPDYPYDRASVEASVLLKKSKVAAFLRHLTEQSLKKFRRGIIALVPKALSILEEALKSESWSLRKWATEIVLDRGLGKPIQPTEIDVGSRLDTLIKELARKRGSQNFVRSNPETPQRFPVSVEVASEHVEQEDGRPLGDSE